MSLPSTKEDSQELSEQEDKISDKIEDAFMYSITDEELFKEIDLTSQESPELENIPEWAMNSKINSWLSDKSNINELKSKIVEIFEDNIFLILCLLQNSKYLLKNNEKKDIILRINNYIPRYNSKLNLQ